ncbi:ATP binding microtubule motor family protein isoform X4 [Carex rostrata]
MDESSPPPPPTTIRRNPHRRARNTPFVPSSLSRFDAAAVATTLQPFSLDEAPETLPPLPSPSFTPAKPSESTTSTNLKVFLRIRPAEIKPHPRLHSRAKNPNLRARAKESPPKTKKNKKTEVCLAVNGPESVTLTIPKSKLVDTKRGSKNEVYDGFSFVFPPESLQTDVYDKVMNPLVKDFMGGKSALLVAMGPTGSGKTYTMFGSNREPGLVPLALKKIFSSGEKKSSQHRSFYLAMLEIYSVSGRGEKMIDLLSDGTELTLVQSTIKGLEEVPVSDLEGAERLIARGMLKRSTAATDANSQSSRSQCIITIRRANDVIDTSNDMPFGNGVLVIADLAGAERDKKTGNMGSRLGESHFINNTSMVFGLCLRSLLEHQRNPKRPLEMHYKNSLLTRYLKEYLEGKKRMTLIITVKPGEDDYVDTSFVLRQAAPYMKIKYTNIEEVKAPPVRKRDVIAVVQQGNRKRRKVVGETHVDLPEAVVISEKVNSEKPEVVQATGDSIIPNTAATVDTSACNGSFHAELDKAKRNEVIMTQFARAFWKTLKLYKDKHSKFENEVLSMRGIIIEKDRQIMELEEELAKLKSCQKQSEQAVSFLDENEVANTDSVSEVLQLTESTDDFKHFKSSDCKNSSAGSRKRGTPSSSNSATASSSIHLLENSLLSDCEQATVMIKEENGDKHTENLIDEVSEKDCLSFDSTEPENFLNGNSTEKHYAEGDPLEMVCPDSNTDEGHMPSTENEKESSVQLIKAKIFKDADPSPSIVTEFTCQGAGLSGGGFAEVSGEKVISVQGSTEEHFGYVDPLLMVCPDSDIDDDEMLGRENETKPCTNIETSLEIADHSPSSTTEARRKGIEFISACYSGEDFAKESGAEGDLSSECPIGEPINDILEQAVSEAAPANSSSSLNLCQTIQKAEVVVLKNNEIYDEDKSSNLELHEFLPDQILREKHFSKDDLLQKVCPDGDADEEEMLCTEKTTQFYVQHIEGANIYSSFICQAKDSDIADFSPLAAEAKRQSSEFVRQRNSSSGSHFAYGSETTKILSFEGSTDEGSDKTLELTGVGEDAASSTASSRPEEIFQESQLDQTLGSLQQLKQDSSSSSEELNLELENKQSPNSEESREETRHDPVGGTHGLPVNVEPKKDLEELVLTSSDHDGKSSVERRKENQPIKSLIEVIGKENRASPSKPFIARKPRRRLRPASSMLLKEFTGTDMDPDIPKEGRGKTTGEEKTRSEGSMSLVQLLTRSIRENNI